MNERKQKTIDDDLYEILELNASEPIIFGRDNNQKHHTYNEDNNKQVILVVPKEHY
jgi:hypothetical protein